MAHKKYKLIKNIHFENTNLLVRNTVRFLGRTEYNLTRVSY
jgi:hypothetical protein